ncbi:hypothetical protein PAPHI01_1047 [Pancytospora philotis]|nr:hypothetical protein PAPHI01_1047 [Pancytospora philotis]
MHLWALLSCVSAAASLSKRGGGAYEKREETPRARDFRTLVGQLLAYIHSEHRRARDYCARWHEEYILEVYAAVNEFDPAPPVSEAEQDGSFMDGWWGSGRAAKFESHFLESCCEMLQCMERLKTSLLVLARADSAVSATDTISAMVCAYETANSSRAALSNFIGSAKRVLNEQTDAVLSVPSGQCAEIGFNCADMHLLRSNFKAYLDDYRGAIFCMRELRSESRSLPSRYAQECQAWTSAHGEKPLSAATKLGIIKKMHPWSFSWSVTRPYWRHAEPTRTTQTECAAPRHAVHH